MLKPGAERMKLGTKTPRVIVVVAVKAPEVPVIVRVVVPKGVVLLAVRIR